MKPAGFEYHRVSSSAEAASMLAELGEDAKILAGGQSLIPLLAMRLTRFDHLVDIKRATDLRELDVNDTAVVLGSLVSQSAVIRDADVATAIPLLPLASRHVGHFQIRNRGTVCGSIAHADPSAEYPAVALALDAEVTVLSVRGERRIPAEDFFAATFETTAAPDELVKSVSFDRWAPGAGFAVEEAARRSGDFAIAGAVAAVQTEAGGAVSRSALALFGVASAPVRGRQAEEALAGRKAAELNPSDLREIGRLATEDLDPPSDIHASSDYRRHLAGVMASRAITAALTAAKGGQE